MDVTVAPTPASEADRAWLPLLSGKITTGRFKTEAEKMGINYFNRNDRDLKFVLFEHLEIDKLLT